MTEIMRRASELAGLDPTTINQIIRREKSSKPRPDTLRLIADALGGIRDLPAGVVATRLRHAGIRVVAEAGEMFVGVVA